jgi:hypothetical protein
VVMIIAPWEITLRKFTAALPLFFRFLAFTNRRWGMKRDVEKFNRWLAQHSLPARARRKYQNLRGERK